MWEILRRFPRAYLWSILLHLTLLVLMVVGIDWRVQNQRLGAFETMIQARMGASAEIEARIAALQAGSGGLVTPVPAPETQPLPRAELDQSEAQRMSEAAAAAARLEAERQAELERQRQAELEAQRRAEEAARREAERQAELERQRQAEREAQRQAELEAQRRAEEQARLAAERQAQRQAELERQRDELRRIREAEQVEARRRAAEEARREAAAAAARERQMLEALQAEEQALAGSGGQSISQSGAQASAATQAQIASRWVPLITSQVRQFWVRPQGAPADLNTVVNLRLDPGGAVIPGSVRIVERSGKAAFDQSVVAAIYRASPLPVPEGDEFELFRDFNFVFRP